MFLFSQFGYSKTETLHTIHSGGYILHVLFHPDGIRRISLGYSRLVPTQFPRCDTGIILWRATYVIRVE